MNVSVVISSPSGLLGPCSGNTGPPVTLRPLWVRHVLAVAILVTTARNRGENTRRLSGVQLFACSSLARLGVFFANVAPEHRNRRPSVSTKTHAFATARGLELVDVEVELVAVEEQLTEVTAGDAVPGSAVDDEAEWSALPHPEPVALNRIATAARCL